MTGQDAAKRAALELALMLTDVHRYGCECARHGHEMDCVPTRQMVAEFVDAAVAEAVKPWRDARAVQGAALNRLGLLGSPVEELERLVKAVKERDQDIAILKAEWLRMKTQRDAVIDEARREERQKYARIGDWRLDKALEHMDRLRTFARTKDDHDFLDRYTGWLLMVRELTADMRPPASAPEGTK